MGNPCASCGNPLVGIGGNATVGVGIPIERNGSRCGEFSRESDTPVLYPRFRGHCREENALRE